MSRRRPEYGCLAIDTEARITADSLTLAGGIVVAGALSDTLTINQTYLQIGEEDEFGANDREDILLTFTGLTGNPQKVEFVGRYEGNAGHNVKLYIWNYTGTPAWDQVTADAADFAHSTTDATFRFELTDIPGLSDLSDYISGGEASLRIYHVSVPTKGHNVYIDYIDIVQGTLALPTAGTAVQLTGLTELASANMTLDGTNGDITVLTDGDYAHCSTISFLATAGADIKLDLYVNGSKEVTLWERRVQSADDIGSASSTAIRTLSKNDVVSWHFESDLPNSSVSIIAMRNQLIKVS